MRRQGDVDELAVDVVQRDLRARAQDALPRHGGPDRDLGGDRAEHGGPGVLAHVDLDAVARRREAQHLEDPLGVDRRLGRQLGQVEHADVGRRGEPRDRHLEPGAAPHDEEPLRALERDARGQASVGLDRPVVGVAVEEPARGDDLRPDGPLLEVDLPAVVALGHVGRATVAGEPRRRPEVRRPDVDLVAGPGREVEEEPAHARALDAVDGLGREVDATRSRVEHRDHVGLDQGLASRHVQRHARGRAVDAISVDEPGGREAPRREVGGADGREVLGAGVQDLEAGVGADGDVALLARGARRGHRERDLDVPLLGHPVGARALEHRQEDDVAAYGHALRERDLDDAVGRHVAREAARGAVDRHLPEVVLPREARAHPEERSLDHPVGDAREERLTGLREVQVVGGRRVDAQRAGLDVEGEARVGPEERVAEDAGRRGILRALGHAPTAGDAHRAGVHVGTEAERRLALVAQRAGDPDPRQLDAGPGLVRTLALQQDLEAAERRLLAAHDQAQAVVGAREARDPRALRRSGPRGRRGSRASACPSGCAGRRRARPRARSPCPRRP